MCFDSIYISPDGKRLVSELDLANERGAYSIISPHFLHLILLVLIRSIVLININAY